ncbi:GrpB family protein [Saccharopolyspora pogona]|uniref:GrpB family protein n=1 Tax=Saccharopolyspora pogona TaxID=333966 RepID=UPI001CC26443|nr:GrpB family protein [Saccharopolyspora pogona]
MLEPPKTLTGDALHVREKSGWHEHRLLRGRNPAVNLHVVSTECPEIQRMLLFRDYLRAHPQARDVYERTKRELAADRWAHVQDYADAKTAVVAEIIAKAAEELSRG